MIYTHNVYYIDFINNIDILGILLLNYKNIIFCRNSVKNTQPYNINVSPELQNERK